MNSGVKLREIERARANIRARIDNQKRGTIGRHPAGVVFQAVAERKARQIVMLCAEYLLDDSFVCLT